MGLDVRMKLRVTLAEGTCGLMPAVPRVARRLILEATARVGAGSNQEARKGQVFHLVFQVTALTAHI
jgi:hypothetical protein